MPTQLVHLYGLVGYLLVKDVYGRSLLTFKSRKFELSSRRYGNGKRPRGMYYIRMGKLYPYLL